MKNPRVLHEASRNPWIFCPTCNFLPVIIDRRDEAQGTRCYILHLISLPTSVMCRHLIVLLNDSCDKTEKTANLVLFSFVFLFHNT